MSENTSTRDIRTLGYVIRRTNYGEADRILNIITPLGKITAIAKGVRKARSKLAGGIEMFSLVDFNIHQGRSEMGVVTGARMVKYYGEILKDYNRMELAGMILKKVSRVAESSDNAEYFELVNESLAELNEGTDVRLIKSWFVLRLKHAMGEEVNLYRDVEGEVLKAERRYEFDVMNEAFYERPDGRYGADEIKLLRLMTTAELKLVKRVKLEPGMLDKVVDFSQMVGKLA